MYSRAGDVTALTGVRGAPQMIELRAFLLHEHSVCRDKEDPLDKIKAMKKPGVYIMIAKHGVLREREEKLKEEKREKRE